MTLRFISFLKNNLSTIIILSIVVFWGGFLRSYHLGDQSLWIDEGYAINASQAILDHGYPTLDSGMPYNQHISHNYLTAGFMKMFGFDPQNPWSARLPAVIFGILSILAIFFFTKKVTKNNLVALTASFLMAFSYWEIAWSRQARGYIDMQFFILLSFIFFYDWLEGKKMRDGLLAILFLVLSYGSHGVALIFIPAFGLLFLSHSIWTGKISDLFSPLRIVFFVLLGSIAVWIILRALPEITIQPYVETYVSFLFTNLKYISFAALTIFLGFFIGKNHSWRSAYIICIILSTFLIIAFFARVIQMRYLLTIFPFLLVALSYGLYLVFVKYEYTKPIFRKILYLLVIGCVTFSSMTFIPQAKYNLEIGSPQPNFRNGYRAISELKKEGDIILSPYTQLSKIYLNDRGLWLPISLTGRTSEIAGNTINNTDYYTGAPIIPTQEALMQILDTQHGYIIIDTMAERRLGSLLTTVLGHPLVVISYYEESKNKEAISVYGFGVGNVSLPVY